MGTMFIFVTAMSPLLSSGHSYCMLSTQQLFVKLMDGTGQLEEKVFHECAGIQSAATVGWGGEPRSLLKHLTCLV